MLYKPYQNILIGTEDLDSVYDLNIYGTIKIRIQSNPNSDLQFSFNEDNPILQYILLDKTGSYEIDLTGISIINSVHFTRVEKGQQIIVDTLRENSIN